MTPPKGLGALRGYWAIYFKIARLKGYCSVTAFRRVLKEDFGREFPAFIVSDVCD